MNQVQQATKATATVNNPLPQQLVLDETKTRDAVGVILVKFTFKDQAHIPTGIEKVDRMPNYQMDVKHQLDALKAGHRGVTFTGRIREGRVDTGTQVIACRRPVQAAMIRRGLAAQGYKLTHLHWFMQEGKAKKGQVDRESVKPVYVVCAAFAKVEDGIKLSSATTKSLRDLADQTWQNCYVWDNPPKQDGVIVSTINFVGPMNAAQKPKEALVACRGIVSVENVIEAVAEEQE